MHSGYYIWQVPGKPATVHMRLDVMDTIQGEVRAAYEGGRRHPGEAAGILLGSKVLVDGHPVVIIDGAEPIACEHRTGPSLSLSDADRPRLEAQIQRLKAEGMVVVGYYRSHTRDQSPGMHLSLSAEDIALLEKWSADAAGVFLLIRPLSATRQLADLYFWHEGRIAHETDFIPFPFGSAAGDERGQLSQVERAVTPPPPRPAALRSDARLWLWVFLCACLGAVAGYRLVIYLSGSATTAAGEARQTIAGPSALFELGAERIREQLVIRWNPELPALQEAQGAGLLIRDGNRQTRYTLDRSQVQGGAMSYAPSTGDVTFVLEAKAAGRNVRETLTVIDPSIDVRRSQ